MDEREIEAMMEDIAAVIKAYVEQELAPIRAKLAELEAGRDADGAAEFARVAERSLRS